MKIKNTLLWSSVKRMFVLLPALACFAYSAQAQFVTVAGSTTSTAGTATIPSAGTGGCAVAPQTVAGGTAFNLVSAVPGTLGAGVQVQTVTLNLTHTFNSDLDIFLVAPNGQVLELTTDNGGGGDNINVTFADDRAALNYPNITTAGAVTIAGIFNPEGSTTAPACGTAPTGTVTTLGGFGGAAAGAWQLQVYDDAGVDAGAMISWSITFAPLPLAAFTIGGVADGGVLPALNLGLCPGTTTSPITVPVVAPVVAGTTLTVQVGTAAPVTVTAGGTFDLPITTVPGSVVLTYNLGPNLATVTQTVNLTTSDNIAPVLTCPAPTTITLTGGECFRTLTLPAATVTDNCPAVLGGTIVFQGFGAQPAGWTTSSTGPGAVPAGLFNFNATASPGGTTNANFVGAIALINDDAAGSTYNPAVETITSAIYNLSSYSNTRLTFNWVNDDFAGAGTMLAQVSGNGGATWTTLPGFPVTADGSGNVNYLIPAGIATSQFRFRFSYDDENVWAWGAAIDNFRISGDLPAGGPITSTFQPTGSPVVVDDATATGQFPIGVTTINYSATDASGNVGTCSTTVTVLPIANPVTTLACNDLIYFSVDANCSGFVNADQVLEGGPYRCYSDYVVELDRIAPFGNGPWTAAFVGQNDIGKTYQYRVTDPVTGNRCWGNIKIEDKLPPVLVCTPLTLPCNFPDQLLRPTSTSTFALSAASSTNEPLPQTLNDLSEVVIDVPVNLGAATITDVDVLVNLSGSVWFNNIEVDVVSPNGTIVTLMSQVGGCDPAPLFARFDDEGATDLSCVGLSTGVNHNIPFNFGLLSSFDGQTATGTWQIRFRDVDGFGDVSSINAAQIFISTALASVNIGLTNGIKLPNPNVQVVNPTTFIVARGLIDACSPVTLTYTDTNVPGTCASGVARTVTRKWQATDASGNSSTCLQTITLIRPTLDNLVCPPNYDDIQAPSFDCSFLDGQYPTPALIDDLGLQGYPSIFGYIDSTQSSVGNGNVGTGLAEACNINYGYTDLVIRVCDGTYKIIRTWQILDFCTGEVAECIQIIKVLDTTGPDFVVPADLTVSVNQDGCCAYVDLPDVIITDNCSRISGIQAMVQTFTSDPAIVPAQQTGMLSFNGSLVNYPGNNLWEPDTLGSFGFTPCLPLGAHVVTYVVTDQCGNTRARTFNLTVLDLEPPVASCDQTTTVAVVNDDPFDCYGPAGPNNVPAAFGPCEFGGVVLIPAKNFDDGSYDNCNNVYFTAQRMNDSPCIAGLNKRNGHPACNDNTRDPISEFELATLENDTIKFYCCEVGTTQTIILRVYQVDANGNAIRDLDGNLIFNSCMVQVEVQDKLKPSCIAPPTAIVDCKNFDPTLWAYGIPQVADNCCLLSAPNNYVYQGVAQCGLTVSDNYSNFDTVCNRGTITRTFTVRDCHNLSTTCQQRVVVGYNQDYYVRFPDDKIVTVCDGTTDFGKPVFFGEDCELLATSFVDQVYTVVEDACYKIERTWTVLNWCTYNPNLPCIDVPNPNPTILNSQANLTGPTVSACNNNIPGWAPTVVRINPTDPTTTNYCTFYDANANCYRYKQIIKVIDGVAPVIQCPASPVIFCDLTSNDPLLWNASYYYDQVSGSHDLCEGPVDLNITATDLCSLSDVNIHYLLFLDLDGDGAMETVINSNTFTLPPAQQVTPGTLQFGNANNPNFTGGTNYTFDFRNVSLGQKYKFAIQTTVSGVNKSAFVRWNTTNSPTNYVIPELPYGTHKIKWFVADGCGNESVCEYQFIVRDCKPPTVTCINGLSINIMPTNPAMVQLWAIDFILYAEDNCTLRPNLKYGIRRSGTGTGFPVNSPGVTFTCADIGTQPVEIWAIDAAGNADFCETYVIVQDNFGACTPGGSHATVAGALKTETSTGLEEGEVEVAGSHPAIPPYTMFDQSNVDGNYEFSNAIPMASNLTITPAKDNNPLNGVTTYDLVLISKHILGIEPLGTPYKMIAADANKSGSITTSDIVELRKLILGIYQKLPTNTSWRFVDKSYAFPNAANPFTPMFPENKTVADIQASQMDDDFVAVKIGDVNGNAIANAQQASDDRTASTLLMDVEDRTVQAGETFDVTFKTAEAAQGFQFTLKLNGLKVTEIAGGDKVSADNFGVFDNALTASVDGAQEFTVRFRAAKAGKISELLSVSSEITKAEGYNLKGERQEVALRFNQNGTSVISGVGFELYQNVPNPFVGYTSIGFNLPAAATATLTIYDESGRMIFTQKGDFAKGANAISVERSVLNTSGMLYYKLETATDMATKKMIQSK